MTKVKLDPATSPSLRAPGFCASCSCPSAPSPTQHDTRTIGNWSFTVLDRTKHKSLEAKQIMWKVQFYKCQSTPYGWSLAIVSVCTSDTKI